jgi:curved DNA-binding protein
MEAGCGRGVRVGMEYRDYYQVLGVPRNASEKEIKRAYRRLARQYHPDRNPGDKAAEEQFKTVNEAHEVLTDPEKRRKYDQLGAQWQQWQQMGRDPRDFDFSQWFAGGPRQTRVEYGNLDDLFGGMGGFSDFFRSVFGEAEAQPTVRWRQAQRRTQRGQDYEQPVAITLEEAYHGTTRMLEVEGNRLEVKIPPGVGTGSKVRMAGKGGRGAAGAPAGDIYLKITLLPHEVFERQGDDLHREIPVDLYTALLGGEVHVPTLKGEVLLKIPPETQAGRSFRLRGRGMPNLHHPDQYGDLLVKVKVVLPEQLSDRERGFFQELAALRRRGKTGKP